MSNKTPADYTADRVSFDNGVQVAWDATSLDLAQTCMRKYYYTIIRGLQPRHKSVHLIFGGIYASALELFYKNRAKGQSIQEALRNSVRLSLEKSWDREKGVPILMDDPKKTRVALIRTVVWYIEEFGDERDQALKTYHLDNGEPAVELSFQIDLETDIVYCGHLDRVCQMGPDLYVVDQKTTGGTIGSYYFRQFDLSNQMTGYTVAGQIILSAPINGVIIDAAQLMANVTKFERGPTTRTKGQLNEWLDQTPRLIESYQDMTEAEFFPQNTNSCGHYNGCPFKQVCATSPEVREHYIKSDFLPHKWDPASAR